MINVKSEKEACKMTDRIRVGVTWCVLSKWAGGKRSEREGF